MLRLTMTGFQLKGLALTLMVLDHIHQLFPGAPDWFNYLGRIVAPIFLFLLAEGFRHSHNRKHYLLRLLTGFWFMNICSLALFYCLPESQFLPNNIFGTLALGLWYMLATERVQRGRKRNSRVNLLLGGAQAAFPLLWSAVVLTAARQSGTAFLVLHNLLPDPVTTEGGAAIVSLALAFYLFPGRRGAGVALILCSLYFYMVLPGCQWMMVFAGLPLLLYRGEEGFKIRRFFYLFYPAHLYLLYLLAYFT
jgi:hypothetical protein